jgi:hypothetical protein
VQEHPVPVDHDEAQERLDDVRVDHVRRPRQQRAHLDRDRLAEPDQEVRTQPAQVLLVPQRHRRRELGHGGPPARLPRADVADADGDVDVPVVHPLGAEELQLRQRDLRADGDDARDVVPVGEVARALAGGPGGRRGRRLGEVDEHAHRVAGRRRAARRRAVDDAVADQEPEEEQHAERDGVRDQHVEPEEHERHEDRQAGQQQEVVEREEAQRTAAAAAPLGAAVDEQVDQQEVPGRRRLRGQRRADRLVQPELGVREPQHEGVDGDAGEADEPEPEGSCGLADPVPACDRPAPELPRQDVAPQPQQQAEERQPLTDRGLGAAGRPRRELVRHLGHARRRVPDEELEQDLEALGAHAVEDDRGPAHHEQAAHRVGHRGQADREQRLAQPRGERRRDRAARAVEAAVRPGPGVPGPDDDVGVLAHRRPREGGRGLRRVLQVGVHHHDPLAARRADAREDRAAEPADAVAGPAVEQVHRDLGTRTGLFHQRRRVVVAVVHEQDLGLQPGNSRHQALQERRDGVPLVARGDDHGQPRAGPAVRRHGENRRRSVADGRGGRGLGIIEVHGMLPL